MLLVVRVSGRLGTVMPFMQLGFNVYYTRSSIKLNVRYLDRINFAPFIFRAFQFIKNILRFIVLCFRDGIKISRLRVDIADLALNAVEGLDLGSSKLMVGGKHLCGAATGSYRNLVL